MIVFLMSCTAAPPSGEEAPTRTAPPDCQSGASVDSGVIPTDIVIQWTSVVEGRASAWRVHNDGRYDWTYGRPLPLAPDDRMTWYEAPPLDARTVEKIRSAVARSLPTLISFEPVAAYLHMPERRGFDAPGVGSAWYTGACEVPSYGALVTELDALLDSDGRARSEMRRRGD